MTWLRREPDHRRITAAHEAGHVIAGRRYCPRTAFHATLTEGGHGWRGRTTATRRTWRGTDLEFAVFLLAGAAAAELVTGHHEIGIDVAHAERQAAAFARRHRREIERAATVLYDRGHI
jgi:hypothetical protein